MRQQGRGFDPRVAGANLTGNGKIFRYDESRKRRARAAALAGGTAVVAALGAIVAGYLIDEPGQKAMVGLPFVLVFGLAILWLAAGAASQIIVTTSDVEVSSEGITLHLTKGWAVRLSWERLKEASVSERVLGRDYRRPGLVGERFTLVQTRHLTVLHTLASSQYGVGFAPVFVVTACHEGYEQAAQRISAGVDSAC